MSAVKKKRSKLFLILGLVLVAVFALVACAANKDGAANGELESSATEIGGVEFVRQIVAQNNETGRTIMWQTDSALTEPALEYRKVGDAQINKVAVESEEFTDDGVTVMLYTARLENLPANTELEYRILGNGAAGPWHSLKTDDGQEFFAMVFPDSQSSDYSGWKQLARDAVSRNPQANFIINMGDQVDNGEDHNQWRAWFDSLDGIMDKLPLAPLMGNHETYNMEWKVRQPVAHLREFATPDNGSANLQRYYYSYDYGPVHFIVLNTQQQELADFSPELVQEQIDWFRKDVAATDKPWKVVLMHKDFLQYRIHNRPERTEGFSPEGEIWMPLFDEAGIDAVLSAHLHTYRNRGHILNFQHDPAGPLYILTGVAGSVRYPGLWIDHALDEYVAPQPETDNYMTMKATADQLDFWSYLSDGTELDHAVITK